MLVSFAEGLVRQSLADTVRRQQTLRSLFVHSGLDTINKLVTGQFQLILLTSHLPDTDSWQVANMIRSGSFGQQDIPIIMACHDSQIAASRPLAEEYTVDLVSLDSTTAVASILNQVIQRSDRQRPSLLIIEDDEDAAHFAVRCLENQYSIDVANDGPLGLELWREHQHDLVLLDVQLPTLSGVDVHQILMQEKASQPVVVLTAFGSRKYHRDFVLGGATAFVSKPIDAEQLRTVCARALHRGRLGQQYRLVETTDEQLQHMTAQVIEAARCLDTGQTATAAYHLRQALALHHDRSLSEDEWADLVRDF